MIRKDSSATSLGQRIAPVLPENTQTLFWICTMHNPSRDNPYSERTWFMCLSHQHSKIGLHSIRPNCSRSDSLRRSCAVQLLMCLFMATTFSGGVSHPLHLCKSELLQAQRCLLWDPSWDCLLLPWASSPVSKLKSLYIFCFICVS